MKYFHVILILIFLHAEILFAQLPTGKWRFDDVANPLDESTGNGQPLQLVGSHQIVDGPNLYNKAVRIGVGSYYKMMHGALPNGGGTFVNQYSLQIDFKVQSIGAWRCFFQTDVANSTDADCAINPNGTIGIGATGYSIHKIAANEWYRLVVSVENGNFYRYYVDGNLFYEGTKQAIDGRFALDSLLLMFADNDGEDGEFDVSEITFWNNALSGSTVKALGGYGHIFGIAQTTFVVPYLQAPTQTSIVVGWHDLSSLVTKVEFGMTTGLGQSVTGTNELITTDYRWHSVKLSGLSANTKYFYRCLSGSDTSKIYSFHTQPDSSYDGHYRFLIFSDTQEDSSWTGKVVRAAKQKLSDLYGANYSDSVHLIMHCGDAVHSGSTISQYSDQIFRPFSALSVNFPMMIAPGNHEFEYPYFYQYMKYDDLSAFPAGHQYFEKIFKFVGGRILFVGLDSFIETEGHTTNGVQKAWLDSTLQKAENRSDIDLVFTFLHHQPLSELWPAGEIPFTKNDVVGTLKKYSKPVQLTYGHVHAYEHGAIQTNRSIGDLHIVGAGGGGGDRDRWGEYGSVDYPEIHTSYDHHFFVLIDVDSKNKSYTGRMFSLGNPNYLLNSVELDRWSRKTQQQNPDTPAVTLPTVQLTQLKFSSSPYSGNDSLMATEMQITSKPGDYTTELLYNTSRLWRNIWGTDISFNPIDKNKGIQLTELSLPTSLFDQGKTYGWRVRYRDLNLKWSEWSNEKTFSGVTSVEKKDAGHPLTFGLGQNYPNPFNPSTVIRFQIPVNSIVTLRVYDAIGREAATLVNDEKEAGSYEVSFDGSKLSSGIYFYTLTARKSDGEFGENYSATKSLALIK
ncbi:MAG: metallophosphoesterase [Bacteroidota bacterium]|nr:metallophosphoesterase [Bacteroidota bacterium]